MRSNVMLKLVVLAGLAFVFAIALVFIAGVVSERERYRGQVVSEVAASTARPQRIVGPTLVVRYREHIEVPQTNGKPEVRESSDQVVLFPDTLIARSKVTVEERRRGIYTAQVYRSRFTLEGTFTIPPRLGLGANRTLSGITQASVVLGVDDLRGMRTPPTLTWRGEPRPFESGSNLNGVPMGVTAEVPQPPVEAGERVPFRVELELTGTDMLSFVPIGGVTRVTMESNWPHPSFDGSFLPDERSIDAHGFRASWTLSRFATGLGNTGERSRLEPQATQTALGVRFVRPVDIYQQSMRAVKYGMLFVLLTFLVFLLFEVLRGLAVHPIQYGLAGAAVAIFFLLLVSLSELIPFGLAYLIASAACVALLTFYVGHVLGGMARGLGFGGFLAVLYGVLYVLLRIEDYALLVGSILLFAVIAAVMVMTRRVDWYRIGETQKA